MELNNLIVWHEVSLPPSFHEVTPDATVRLRLVVEVCEVHRRHFGVYSVSIRVIKRLDHVGAPQAAILYDLIKSVLDE